MEGKIKKLLALHHVSTSDKFNEKLLSLKVFCAQYQVLAAFVWSPSKKSWFKLNEKHKFFKRKEMIEMAMQCLYYVNLPLGVCVIQRGVAGICHVHSINKIDKEKLPEETKQKIENSLPLGSQEITFGADVEGLMFHEKRKKYITASSLFKSNDTLGYDNAIIVKENRTKHHILEVRPLPAKNGLDLYRNILHEYAQLQKVTNRYQLAIVGGASPISNILLGGHFHIGNHTLNHQVVRIIDLFFGIPMSITEKEDALKRRSKFGRLGSVRKNKYNGFEYRTLSSWIEQIPSMKPVFLWFSLLLKSADLFQSYSFSKDILIGYYEQNNSLLVKEIKLLHLQALSCLFRPSHQEIANDFFAWVLERSVSTDKELSGNML